MALRIIFAGTPDFAAASLQALLQTQHKIIAVYTQPDRPAGRGLKLTPSPVKQLALQYHLPIYQPKSLRDEQEQTQLKQLAADVMVVAAYGLILPKAVLAIPRLGCINVHGSLLPRWRGAAPIQRAILAGDHETGITIMQMNEGLDTGDMLLTRSCEINAEITMGELHDELAKMGAELLIEALKKIDSELIHPIKQDDTKATYAAKIQKDEAQIQWNKSAAQLSKEIRAFNPWPGSFTQFNHERLKIWKAQSLNTVSDLTPGTLVAVSATHLDVATGDGTLRLLQIQLAGGRMISAADFIKAQQRNLIAGETIFG